MQASFGLSKQISIAFAPEIVIPYNVDKTNWNEAAIINAKPEIMCQKTTTIGCGGCMDVGFSVVSADWKDRFTKSSSVNIIVLQISNTLKYRILKRFKMFAI
tara:strand:+ start:456 stop:761 length:306 start_codon:yes stop_codon:yes gene_type:complete